MLSSRIPKRERNANKHILVCRFCLVNCILSLYCSCCWLNKQLNTHSKSVYNLTPLPGKFLELHNFEHPNKFEAQNNEGKISVEKKGMGDKMISLLLLKPHILHNFF